MTVFTLLTLLCLLQSASSSLYPSDYSPTPAPAPATFTSDSSPIAASPLSPSPSPTQIYSPPALPPSSYLGDSPSPAPTSTTSSPAPTPNSSDSSTKSSSSSPSLSEENEANHESRNYVSEEVDKKSSGGHKLGVAFGVVGGACVLVFGGTVYKKRRENVRRSRYGYRAGNIELI